MSDAPLKVTGGITAADWLGMTPEQKSQHRARQWARWRAMWDRVSPVVETKSWWQKFQDGHDRAYTKEAICKAALARSERAARIACQQYARRYQPAKQFDAWTERLMAVALEVNGGWPGKEQDK